MRILKTEVTDSGRQDRPRRRSPPGDHGPPTQLQVEELQQQVRDLQAKDVRGGGSEGGGAPAAGTRHTPAS